MKAVTNDILKQLFPKYAKDIEPLSRQSACGCSLCTFQALQREHPEDDIKLPKEHVEAYFG